MVALVILHWVEVVIVSANVIWKGMLLLLSAIDMDLVDVLKDLWIYLWVGVLT